MGQSVIPAENCEKPRRSNPPKEAVESEDVKVIKLSREDSLIFAKAIISPPKPSPALIQLFELHRRSVINE